MREHKNRYGVEGSAGQRSDGGSVPGRRSLTEQLQRKASGSATANAGSTREVATEGVSGTASSFPHQDQIECSFGQSIGASAHFDDAAIAGAKQLGAEAYTLGAAVAFSSPT